MNNIKSPVLVTGGTGFIGTHLIDKLLALEVEVVSFSLPSDPVPKHWGDRVKVVRGDVCDASAVNAAMQGVGTVFHLAAALTGGDYDSHWRITVEGSRHVFDAALKEGTKVIHCSSITVYGEQIAQGVCHDGLPQGKQFHGPYSRAKMAQEKLALEYRDNKGLPLVVIRPANVYGVGSSWVNIMAEVIAADMLVIIGDGNGDGGFVHASNLADAFILAASKQEALGEIFTVADGFGITWKQYFNNLAALQDKAPLPHIPLDAALHEAQQHENPEALIAPGPEVVITLEGLSMVGHSNRYDSSKIKNMLGWAPQVSYETGFAQIKESLTS